MNNYIIVLPDGETKGFRKEEDTHMFIQGYYEEKVGRLNNDIDLSYEDYATEPLEATIGICVSLGAYEGECVIYQLEDVLEKINKSGLFPEEKQEIIEKLTQDKIEFNVFDYQIDNILKDATVIPHR
ncbi:hypothetical protein SAMN02745196_00166 [Clostridium collagenovorans DSM 3089]|uniref:Uncharacterized protein n=1 Tax=Clostridium collagenovorans DSM 3089 TaxID=1121306 RepID=A0A1M5SH31_9CLOT|nr:hypothetical protein [Clostridium collagenovorans]SHH37775.1 hypothetical protein SAMN02745196_00166 [Clostridium collagenovorans DSM 3089]